MKHVHAELMMQYAQDALKTDKPWELWERSFGCHPWRDLVCNPSWEMTAEYRRKPNGKIVMIDGEEFIVPKSFNPNIGDAYHEFTVDTKSVHCYVFHDEENDDALNSIRSGNCYRTKEEAEQALSFWRKVNEV